MSMEWKERSSTQTSTVTGNIPSSATTSTSLAMKEWHQRTLSDENPLFQWLERKKIERGYPSHIVDFMSRQDLGSAFRTEKGSIESNTHSVDIRNYYTAPYRWAYEGPLYISGFNTPMSLATSQEMTNLNATLFALGGTAIARCRPGKPQVDLANTIGELRMGGIPTIVGSLYSRSKSLRDVFRNSGNEYLNIQFGWLPLIRDLEGLAQVALNTRRLLQGHEKKLNKLLQRSYRFDTLINTQLGLTKSASNYELEPWATASGSSVRLGTVTGLQVPIEITRTVTKSHFSGGFRFYYPDISTSLDALTEIEHNANLLLGTRLDPEVLWNLQPWTWLIDWFINFGDVLGNLSAILADGLVIQYGYIMQESEIYKEITLPRGVWSRGNSPLGLSYFTEKPLTVTLRYHSKVRAKASPFGFGLTPEMFSSQQWAILAALGISRGLK